MKPITRTESMNKATDARTPVDLLNDLILGDADGKRMPSGQARWLRYFEPVPALSEDLPVPIIGIMVLIWQTREADLQQLYPLTSYESRLGFTAWCAIHGVKEYAALRQADRFIDALRKPAVLSATTLPPADPAHAISAGMALVLAHQRSASFNLNTERGRKAFLIWFLLRGLRDHDLPHLACQDWQLEYLYAQSHISGFSRLQALVYEGLNAVQTAFPLPEGKQAYLTWFQSFLAQADNGLLRVLCPEPEDRQDAKLAQDREPGVNIIGHVFSQSGIGEESRMAARSLMAAGVPFAMIDLPPGPGTAQNERGMAEYVTTECRYGINLFNLPALEQGRFFLHHGAAALEGRRNIGFWLWELPRWPAAWRHLFSLVDEVWASSPYIHQIVQDTGLAPVRLMPASVELDAVSTLGRKDFGLPARAKLFVFAFDLNSSAKRKNPHACIAAFQRAFPDKRSKSAGLVIKVHPPKNPDAEWDALKQLAAEDARIYLIEKTLSKPDLLALYQACDCFVSLHRAEGFGRNIAEAMLLGKSVIVTGFSGNLAFNSEENAMLVRYSMQALADGDYPYGDGQQWAEPDIGHAADLMRKVVKETAAIKTLAANGKKTIEQEHGVARVGAAYAKALNIKR
jgi:hypothetical protein